MPSPLEYESLGDWNNLKGTEYHFVYALWLLLREKVPSVAFYQGNDLLARPIMPPIIQDASIITALHVQQPLEREQDLWIQLKATENPWTLTELGRDNLLANFLYNALFSEREGRTWKVQIITQAEMRAAEIKRFLDQPQSKPTFLKRLNKIIAQVKREWQKTFHGTIDTTSLRAHADAILQQLAETRPIRLETLKAQIETQIAYQRPDPEGVRAIAQRLLGGLLTDTARGPESAITYTAEWIEQNAGLPLVPGTLLTNDPVRACAESLNAALPRSWNSGCFVARPLVHNALNQFLLASQTLFVLIGMGGVGKTWVVADWVTRGLQENCRLLIKGSELYSYRAAGTRELSMLVAGKLRSYAPADWSDETILRRILPTPVPGDRDRYLAIVIDDLRFPGDREEAAAFLQYLQGLIEQCREHKVKLVLTCSRYPWHFYRLGRAIQPQDLFVVVPDEVQTSEQATIQENIQYSFLLSDFTFEEMKGVLKQSLAAENVEHIALLLRAPAFTALRNPYILDLYLKQYGASLSKENNIPLVEIDTLLKRRVQKTLSEVVEGVGCSQDQVDAAFEALQQNLWQVRPAGLTTLQVLEILRAHYLEPVVLQEMRRVGIIAADNPVRFAEPAIADFLFATCLYRRMKVGEDICGELRPETDMGVIIALLRILPDPVVWAERFLTRDSRWLAAVTEGLAQQSADDYKILSFLSVLTRPKANEVGPEACEALGLLASRGRKAWEWLERMYLSDRIMERLRGERALATTIEYAPERVETVIQQRLEQVAQMDDSKREKKEQLLQGALTPLLQMRHSHSAEVGRRVLHQYRGLIEQRESRYGQEALKDLDIIRGQIALVMGEDEIHGLVAELQADDPDIRRRAAYALQPLVFERPESVQEALCKAIKREQDSQVMNHLLWSAYRLEEVAPEMLLDAIEASIAVRWQEPSFCIGITLAVLADVATQYPARVQHLLPRRLETYEPWARALLSEMVAYAWWRCAQTEYMPSTNVHLASLIEPDPTDTPLEFRLFVKRGAVIARLGTMCLELGISSDSLSGRQSSYPLGTLQFFYLNLTAFIARHASSLKTHPQFDQWRAELTACVYEEEQVPAHPGSALRNARYLCARSCKDILHHLDEASQPAWHDPEEAVSYLALDHVGRTAEFASLLQAPPDSILSVLDQQIRDEDDLPILYYWKEAATSWPSLLVSRVYARMFDVTPIDKEEALELCAQMLSALKAVHASPERQQYETVYETIASSLQGGRTFPQSLPSPTTTLQRTHAHALSLVERASEEQDSAWIHKALYDRRGWLDTTRYQLEDNGIVLGTYAYTAYIFPAVRLAGIAVGQLSQLDDPAAQLLRERLQVNDVLKEHWRALDGSIPIADRSLQAALAALEECQQKDQYDERLWQYRGLVLLRLDRSIDAEKALQRCLALPWCAGDTRADAYYNLGCVYARMDREDDCRQMLQKWVHLQPRNQLAQYWLMQDTDLETMREKPWFHEL